MACGSRGHGRGSRPLSRGVSQPAAACTSASSARASRASSRWVRHPAGPGRGRPDRQSCARWWRGPGPCSSRADLVKGLSTRWSLSGRSLRESSWAASWGHCSRSRSRAWRPSCCGSPSGLAGPAAGALKGHRGGPQHPHPAQADPRRVPLLNPEGAPPPQPPPGGV